MANKHSNSSKNGWLRVPIDFNNNTFADFEGSSGKQRNIMVPT